MKRCHLKGLGGAILLTCLGGGLCGCPPIYGVDTATEIVTEQAALVSNATVAVVNSNGEIRITGGAVENVVIEAEKRVDVHRNAANLDTEPEEFLAELEVLVTSDEGGVTVETVVPAGFWLQGVVAQVDYDITVPAQVPLDLEVANGGVYVDGVQGMMAIDVANGEVECLSVGGNLDITVANGSVDITHPVALAADESMACDVQNGSIEIALPAASNFDVEAYVTVGGIDTGGFDFDVNTYNLVGQHANDTVGTGGATIDLDVELGGVTFQRL